MKLSKYLKDKIFEILLFTFTYLIIFLLLLAFKSKKELIISIMLIILMLFILLLLINYFRKKNFYNDLIYHINELDKSYLVLETLKTPNFYEGELLCNALYDINKSMIENVKNYELQVNDFKNYIEMWIHEVKLPLSALVLMTHNHKNEFTTKELNEIKKIENYLEQVLYYTRSENANKDYLINKVNLKKSINTILLKNKDYLLENNINLIVNKTNYEVYTDSKWLEFILNQIINNSIKYKDDKKESYIKIDVRDEQNKIILEIEDNGIGIKESDLSKVFDKTFTGINGRNKTNSTGMGLFIAKNLCTKLGHSISIDSRYKKYTKVSIIFYKNNYYEVLN